MCRNCGEKAERRGGSRARLEKTGKIEEIWTGLEASGAWAVKGSFESGESAGKVWKRGFSIRLLGTVEYETLAERGRSGIGLRHSVCFLARGTRQGKRPEEDRRFFWRDRNARTPGNACNIVRLVRREAEWCVESQGWRRQVIRYLEENDAESVCDPGT